MKTRNESSSKSAAAASSRQASKSGEADPAPGGDCSRDQLIAEAAYYRAERRGFEPGNEMSDWFEAESEINTSLLNTH